MKAAEESARLHMVEISRLHMQENNRLIAKAVAKTVSLDANMEVSSTPMKLAAKKLCIQKKHV
jgi:hypothetical protein